MNFGFHSFLFFFVFFAYVVPCDVGLGTIINICMHCKIFVLFAVVSRSVFLSKWVITSRKTSHDVHNSLHQQAPKILWNSTIR